MKAKNAEPIAAPQYP